MGDLFIKTENEFYAQNSYIYPKKHKIYLFYNLFSLNISVDSSIQLYDMEVLWLFSSFFGCRKNKPIPFCFMTYLTFYSYMVYFLYMEASGLKYLPSDKYKFREYEKLNTYQILSSIGCPVLKSVLIENNDILTPCVIDSISKYFTSKYCTIRYQYTRPNSKPVRGGNKIILLYDALIRNKVPDTLLWLLEPVNRLTNIYGINLYFNRKNETLLLECVGRGFDTSNLNRGDMNPHQSILFQLPLEYGYYSEWWKFAKFKFISKSQFEEYKCTRLKKLHDVGIKADEGIFDSFYKPLSSYWIEKIMEYSIKIYDHLVCERDFVVSCSILENNKIIFWDIATPKGKIKTFLGDEYNGKQLF